MEQLKASIQSQKQKVTSDLWEGQGQGGRVGGQPCSLYQLRPQGQTEGRLRACLDLREMVQAFQHLHTLYMPPLHTKPLEPLHF